MPLRPEAVPGPTRRDVLRAAMAGLALPVVAQLPGCKAGKGTSVVVVGAGAAGLWAAQLLLDKGFDVTLLEASDRHGGRIRDDTSLASYPIELGAEEVHGSNSVFYSMCADANVSFVDESQTTDRFWMQASDGAVALHDESVVSTDDALAAADQFITDVYASTGDDVTVTTAMDSAAIEDRCRFYVEARVGNEYGSDDDHVGVVSLADDDALWSSGPSSYAIADSSILAIIELACSDAWPLVQTGAVVTTLTSTPSSVTATLADGSTVTAEFAVLTVSLGVLKAGLITFSPALSAAKQAAIAGVGFGHGMKIILAFSTRFWPDDLGSLYGADHVPELWATGFGRTANPLELTAFVMGASADVLTAAGEGAVALVLADLDTIFAGAATPAFVASVVQDWTLEPFILGSYSFPSPGSSAFRADLATAEGRVHFAGEATHTSGMYATVHGALETAERAVQEILDLV